jgi:Flp pilus assembly pilin Flp
MIDRIVVWALTLKAKLSSERGQDIMEYALLGGFIAVAFVVAALATPLGDAMQDMTNAIGECVDFDQTCP